MVLAHGAQTPGSAKSPTRDSLEAQPVEFESLMQESGSADFLARHALYSQPPLCVCVCVCALSAAELCFGLPDPAMVSHLGSSLHPGQMPRDGARMERALARQTQAWHASETRTGGMSKRVRCSLLLS